MSQTKGRPAAGAFAFKIKTIVLGAVGALALLAVANFGWEASQGWQTYARAADQHAFSAAADRFIKGTYAILLERLATDSALQAPAAADAAATGRIGQQRKAVAELYDAGLAAIALHSFPNKQALVDDLRVKIEKAEAIRRQADASIALPREQRDEGLRTSFAPIMTEMVNASLTLWYAAVYSTAKGDSDLERLAVVKEIGWKMREFSGLARAAVATAIAGRHAIPPAGVAALAEHRARVTALWMMLENLAKDPQTHPAILQAMRDAQSQYFKGFVPSLEDMRKAGEAGQYPMTAAQWVETTNPQIDSLLAVMQAAAAASDARARELADAAFRRLMIDLGLLTLCIVILLAAVAAVIGQVTRPLSALAAAMHKLALGDFDVVLPGLGRRNEIGEVAGAVELFKVKAVEKAQREAQAQREEDLHREATRKSDMRRLADEFQRMVGGIVESVSTTAAELETAAGSLAATAETTDHLSGAVSSAASEASGNVQSAASATEEMASSVADIARQVQASSRIAGDAVKQAERTDARIAELSMAANRIGDVVKLITAIAEQTNRWRSMPRSRPRAPGMPEGALRSSPRRSRRSRRRPRRRPRRSPVTSRRCRPRPANPSWRSRKSAARSAASQRSRRRSRLRSNNKVPRPRKSRATSSRWRAAPRRSQPRSRT